MSKDWVNDISEMHEKYGVHDWVKTQVEAGNAEVLREFLQFRLGCLSEELQETYDAVKANDPEEIVDGLIDLCVFAIGTLDIFGVNAHKAWDAVYEANMNKQVGQKATRPNRFGLPDLIKPEDWQAPSHEHNHGILHGIQ